MLIYSAIVATIDTMANIENVFIPKFFLLCILHITKTINPIRYNLVPIPSISPSEYISKKNMKLHNKYIMVKIKKILFTILIFLSSTMFTSLSLVNFIVCNYNSISYIFLQHFKSAKIPRPLWHNSLQ